VETHFFSTSKKLKNVPSAKKVMMILFRDIIGPIFEHYMEHGQTVNSERYSAMLKNKLKPAIRSKWRGLLSKTVLLHRDTARTHSAAATVKTIQKLNFELLPHPAYSPDLAPSDYRLFGSLKKALLVRRFGSYEEVKHSVQTLGFATNQKHFSVMEMRSLLNVVKSVCG
jgi:hypothetical protein